MHPVIDLLTAIPPKDLAVLLPHRLVPRVIRWTLGQRPDEGTTPPVEGRDPEFLGKVLAWARWVGQRYFRWSVEGVENVPAAGPALLVGNHNGGLMAWDALLTHVAIWDRFGPTRAVHGLAHDFLHWDPVLRQYSERFGALPAGHGNAARAFEAGDLVLVYPGSDFDACRPFRDRGRIVLAGRTGFIRLALRQGVPIVPVVTAGAQEEQVVLTRGELLAKSLDLPHRLRTKVFPLALSVPWGLTSAYLPHLPLPTQISTTFLPPLRFDHLGPEAADDQRQVDRCYAEVQRSMQSKLDHMEAARLPWLGPIKG